MPEIRFRAWHIPDRTMYFRAYQKITFILLCTPKGSASEGDAGVPAYRARFEDCILMECTGLKDIHGRDIYESDIIEILTNGKPYQGTVGTIPDMFRSRGLHPLQDLLDRLGIASETNDFRFNILGNIYETPELIPRENNPR